MTPVNPPGSLLEELLLLGSVYITCAGCIYAKGHFRSPKMELILHSPNERSGLSQHYKRAFSTAVELYIVSAYLTDWDSTRKLNRECKRFLMLIGKDFGITRKAACKEVMRWLPPERKTQFRVAHGISGFHPKAIFWKEKKTGRCYAIIGSSNLTRAAFDSNYEANTFSSLSPAQYATAKSWIQAIDRDSRTVTDEWLSKYQEASLPPSSERNASRTNNRDNKSTLIRLPNPPKMRVAIVERRDKLVHYKRNRNGLMRLFRQCADAEISSEQFYERLPRYWGHDAGDRLTGKGLEITAKHSNFRAVSRSFLTITRAPEEDRDFVVVEEIDRLAVERVPTRRAFLSEMLCLRYPGAYPVLNKPVSLFLRDIGYRAPRKASEGDRYIHIAKTLRSALRENPDYPARNLAELDIVIWYAYAGSQPS
jgi:HKD family nuclease